MVEAPQEPREIEAKYQIDDAGWQLLPTVTSIGVFALTAAPEPEIQHNIYFDTPDLTLHAMKYGLRIRELRDRRIATLKGPATVRDGLHERSEWEAMIGDDDRPEGWPASEVRTRALTIANGRELLPILTIATLRRHIYATVGDRRIAELSLDEAEISAGGRTELLRELEVELLADGTRAEFEALLTALDATLTLAPQHLSKLARGFALLGK